MQVFTKIFLTVTLLLCASLSAAGYLLISISVQNTMEQEKDQIIDQYQVTKFLFQSELYAAEKEGTHADDERVYSFRPASVHAVDDDGFFAVFSDEKKPLYSEYPDDFDFSILDQAATDRLVYQIHDMGGTYLLTVAGAFAPLDQPLYLVFGRDISAVMEQRNQLVRTYGTVYLIVCSAALLLLLLFTSLLLRPLKRTARFTAEIADGHYDSRLPVTSHDEFGKLAEMCNVMAEAVQQSVERLTLSAIQNEDFVANFSHELKTPLTSVIGYADMICQRDLPRAETKQAAQYILEEGLRLESLSHKLMDLFIAGQESLVTEPLSAAEILNNLADTLRPLCQERNVELTVSAEDQEVQVDFDLFKSLLLNLADNAIKAGATRITLTGAPACTSSSSADAITCISPCSASACSTGAPARDSAGSAGASPSPAYRFSVIDNGCGIPAEEIHRITEAFYMVDKSRSRKQHGAGIGLALSERIARLHGASLDFESTLGVGTTVTVTLPPQKGGSL